MEKKFENKDRVLMENAFFTQDNIGVYGWYGLDYFEIENKTDFINLNRNEFLTLYNLVVEMKKEIDRLENLQYN